MLVKSTLDVKFRLLKFLPLPKLGYNEHLVTTNKYFGPKCPFTTQIDPVITNLGYNEQIWPELFVITELYCITFGSAKF